MFSNNSHPALQAPAKINLGLEVLQRRADGFHDINTLFATVNVCDTIALAPRDDGRITCLVAGNEALAAEPSNLCITAAELLRKELGNHNLGLDIQLTKVIPTGAGLGGGSSDAATVLRTAVKLWGYPENASNLQRLALQLGSDVPFFLYGGLCHAASRGEVLTPLPLLLPYSILLVNPGIHVPTPWAYAAIGRTGNRPGSNLPDILARGLQHPHILREELVNDFEEPVFARYPALAELKNELYRQGALFALMSGSGSTLFGLFAIGTAARNAQDAFKKQWTAVAAFTER